MDGKGLSFFLDKRKKRKLVIGSDDEDDVEVAVTQNPPVVPKVRSPLKSAKSTTPAATTILKNANQITHLLPAPLAKRDTGSKGKIQEKQLRKVEEKQEEVVTKFQKLPESDGHDSDADLFIPDESNTNDLEPIRQKNGWKKKQKAIVHSDHPPIVANVISKPPQSRKEITYKSREEPQRKPKDALVYDVLKRWWYALPDWPPASFDYGSQLEQHKLRLVNKQKFRFSPDFDDKGFSKCYEVVGFNGVFKDYKNKTFDLRPLENKPCYTTFSQKSTGDLISLLRTALQNQISALETSKVVDPFLLAHLKKQFERVKDR